MDINMLAKKIENKKDFEDFLKELIIDFEINKSDWHNNRLDLFLEGLYGYNFDSENEPATWSKFAEMLLAAKVYE
ncbi:hypothetical protein FACS189429_8090 [Bacteroidia bacterium]|nr:hypothetical protein FACS189429_8090 [Bacteroidia bacterium]